MLEDAPTPRPVYLEIAFLARIRELETPDTLAEQSWGSFFSIRTVDIRDSMFSLERSTLDATLAPLPVYASVEPARIRTGRRPVGSEVQSASAPVGIKRTFPPSPEQLTEMTPSGPQLALAAHSTNPCFRYRPAPTARLGSSVQDLRTEA